MYFSRDRRLFNCQLGGVEDGEEPLVDEELTMEEAFDQARPDLDEEEARRVKALVRQILQYDPTKRPTAEEILSDPWFASIAGERSSPL